MLLDIRDRASGKESRSHWEIAVADFMGWAAHGIRRPVPVPLLGERIRIVLWCERSKRGRRDNGLVVLLLALRDRVGL